MTVEIPKEISAIGATLTKAGYKAYLVGGCVRDLILSEVEGRPIVPKDWDITTNAKPEEIQKLFATFGGRTEQDPATVYENNFGTVLVKLKPRNNADKTPTDAEGQRESALSPRKSAVEIVEITTFRQEGKYTDKRHPDEIKFAKTVEEDLARRDFTINAMAMALIEIKNQKSKIKKTDQNAKIGEHEIVDPYKGQEDLKKKIIRTVGDAGERFNEDALRLMRAVRFAAQLGFEIDRETAAAVKKHAPLLELISKERVRDELVKLLMTDRAVAGIEDMRAYGLLRYALPELLDGVNVAQNKHHIYSIYEHNLRSLAYAVEKNFPLDLRVAALLHDVGKPKTKHGEGPNCTFYGHQVVGERIAVKMLDRLHFPRPLVEKVALLIREHMFVYDPESVTLAGVRRIIRRVGTENINDLMLLREADRIGSGVPKAQPYRLRYLKAMIEKVQKDPIHPKMMVVKGEDVMKILDIPPGPKVGKVLAALLEEVLERPELNEAAALEQRVRELGGLSEKELDAIAAKARAAASAAQERIDAEIKKKYFV